jgi:hypothetical protein
MQLEKVESGREYRGENVPVHKFEVAENCTMRNFVNYNSHHILGNKIKECEMGGTCSTKTPKEMCIKNLVKAPEGERPLENAKHRRRPNINMDLINRMGYHRWRSSGSRGEKNVCFEHYNEYEVAYN